MIFPVRGHPAPWSHWGYIIHMSKYHNAGIWSLEHGLKDIKCYVQKHIAPWAIYYNPPPVSEKPLGAPAYCEPCPLEKQPTISHPSHSRSDYVKMQQHRVWFLEIRELQFWASGHQIQIGEEFQLHKLKLFPLKRMKLWWGSPYQLTITILRSQCVNSQTPCDIYIYIYIYIYILLHSVIISSGNSFLPM